MRCYQSIKIIYSFSKLPFHQEDYTLCEQAKLLQKLFINIKEFWPRKSVVGFIKISLFDFYFCYLV